MLWGGGAKLNNKLPKVIKINYTVTKFWVEMAGSDKWTQLVDHVTIQRHISCINKLLRVLNQTLCSVLLTRVDCFFYPMSAKCNET